MCTNKNELETEREKKIKTSANQNMAKMKEQLEWPVYVNIRKNNRTLTETTAKRRNEMKK